MTLSLARDRDRKTEKHTDRPTETDRQTDSEEEENKQKRRNSKILAKHFQAEARTGGHRHFGLTTTGLGWMLVRRMHTLASYPGAAWPLSTLS